MVGGKFSEVIAKALELSHHVIERRVYPDSEVCPRIKIKGKLSKEIFFILQPKRGQNLNAYLTEFLITLNNLTERVKKVHAFMPYMVYARQDKAFRNGEPVSSKIVADLIKKSGATSFTAINTHPHRIGIGEIFDMKAYNLSAIPLLAEFTMAHYDLVQPFILAPDDEAIDWAKEFASVIGTRSYDAIHKERDFDTGAIETDMPEVDLTGRDVVIVDDIIATGGTMIAAIKHARSHGAKSVIACAVHPVLVHNALEKLENLKVRGLFTTNTIPSSISQVDVRPVLIEKIRNLLKEHHA